MHLASGSEQQCLLLQLAAGIHAVFASGDEVRKLGVPTFMVESGVGQDYRPRTIDSLTGMKAMAAFCHG